MSHNVFIVSHAFLFVLCCLLFFIAPQPVKAVESSVLRGTVTSVITCANSAGYFFTIGSANDSYLFVSNTSQSIPRAHSLRTGDLISGVASSTTTCVSGSGNSAIVRTGKAVVYYGVTATTDPVQVAPDTTPPEGNDSGGFDSILNQVQSFFNDIFKSPTSPTTAIPTTPANPTPTLPTSSSSPTPIQSKTGSPASPFNFGGMIGASVPCDPTSSVPAGPGVFMITIGPPLGGQYMYAPPPVSRSYLCLPPPLAIGQNTTGSFTPGGICDICLSPETYCPIPTIGIMNPAPGHGTSGCAVPASTPSKPAPPPSDCTQAICQATNSSIGMSSANAAGTTNGRRACVWAVNQVLTKAGIAPIDHLGVVSMENSLRAGRGTPVSPSEAKCGDIVIQAGREHVGICLNDGCTRVVSNSSGRAQFNWFSGTDFKPSYNAGPGRIYRVQCSI